MNNFSYFGFFEENKCPKINFDNNNEKVDYISIILKYRALFSILISLLLIVGKIFIQNSKKSLSEQQKKILGFIILDYIIFKKKKKIFSFYSQVKMRLIEKEKNEKISNFIKNNSSQINNISNKLLLVINILKYKLFVEKSINTKVYIQCIHSLSEIIYSGKKDMIKIMKKFSKNFIFEIYEWERKELEKIKIFKRKYLLKERYSIKTLKHFINCLFPEMKK
jgi:hypothetical protein